MHRLGRQLLAAAAVAGIVTGAAGAAAAQDSPVLKSRALKLVDSPTAEIMQRGVYDLSTIFYPDGGVLVGVEIGLLERFNLGFNYGGLRILGRGEPEWNPRVEFNARYQLAPESFALPSLTLGFDSQGYGYYDESLERYQVKSKGFFAVASRNYSFMGRMALHGGANFSVEGEDGARKDNPNLFFGVEKSLGPDLDVMAEYDAALNDGGSWDSDGRLNLGVVWSYAEQLHLQLDVRNILRSEEGRTVGGSPVVSDDWSRGIQILYRERF